MIQHTKKSTNMYIFIYAWFYPFISSFSFTLRCSFAFVVIILFACECVSTRHRTSEWSDLLHTHSHTTFVFWSPILSPHSRPYSVLFVHYYYFIQVDFPAPEYNKRTKKIEKKTMTTLNKAKWSASESGWVRRREKKQSTDKLFALAAFLSDSCSDKMSQYDKQNGNFIIQLTFLEHVKFTYGKPTDAHFYSLPHAHAHTHVHRDKHTHGGVKKKAPKHFFKVRANRFWFYSGIRCWMLKFITEPKK